MDKVAIPPEVQLELIFLKTEAGLADLSSKAEAARLGGIVQVCLKTETALALLMLAAEGLER